MTTANDVYARAVGELGYHEGRDPNGNWNNDNKYAGPVGVANRQAWCQTFQTWLLLVTGAATLGPQHCDYTITALNWFDARDRLSYYPTLGAQAYMGPGGGEHVEFVYAYDDAFVYTIGGNTNTNGSSQGDGVYRQKRPRRDGFIYAYGIPNFAGGVATADPLHSVAGTRYAQTASLEVIAPPPPPPPPTIPTVSLGAVLAASRASSGVSGNSAPSTTLVQNALVKLGFASFPDRGTYGPLTLAGYSKFQRSLGYTGSINQPGSDADGHPGATSLGQLATLSGLFKVVA